MTVREKLIRQERWWYGLFFTGVLLFAAGAALEAYLSSAGKISQEQFSYFILPGVLTIFGTVVYVNFALRCPKCRSNMGFMLNWGSNGMKSCPYCGVSLDSEI